MTNVASIIYLIVSAGILGGLGYLVAKIMRKL